MNKHDDVHTSLTAERKSNIEEHSVQFPWKQYYVRMAYIADSFLETHEYGLLLGQPLYI